MIEPYWLNMIEPYWLNMIEPYWLNMIEPYWLNMIEPYWLYMKRQTTRRGAPVNAKEAEKSWISCWKDMKQGRIQR
jgi:hypothetical protein